MPVTRAPRPSIPVSQLWPIAREAATGVAELLRRRARGADELDEARELLAYWERRARRLPRWALRRRREARASASLWRARVADAERLRYGDGLLGAASLYASERRVPATAAHRGRQLARAAGWTAVMVVVTVLLVAAAAIAVVAEAALSLL